MAVILVGEIVNSCDTVTGWNQGNVNTTDDDNVEGIGAIGLKVSNATSEMYTTTLGVTAPYDFSSTGAEAGYHVIMWMLAKTKITVNADSASSGLRILVGNGTDRGHWYVTPSGFYKGGFITRVIDTSKDFNVIAAGTWTLGGNPAQLSNITEVGGVLDTTGQGNIMGNFNNFQLDQMTIGLGLQVSGGTVGTPNTFEEVRIDDEDTNFYGWWTSSNGAILGKGKLYIGANNGSTVFNDIATAVIFADELVADDFYEIIVQGTGTTCNFELSNIASADSDLVRWDLNIDSNSTFGDTNSVWSGSKNITLSSNAGLTGTTIIDGQQLYQSGGTLDGVTVLANATGFTSYIRTNNPEDISNSVFEFNEGHAIELLPGTSTGFTFSNNKFIGYGASGTTSAAIYNNSSSDITINITDGGDSPTIRNGTGANTTVINAFTLTLTNVVDNSEIRIFDAGTTTEVGGIENTSGGTFVYAYDYQAGTFVDIVVFNVEYVFNEPSGRIKNFELVNSNGSIPINQLLDRNYLNP